MYIMLNNQINYHNNLGSKYNIKPYLLVISIFKKNYFFSLKKPTF